MAAFFNLPTTPDGSSGRTYRVVVNHGFVRYGTQREYERLKSIENAQPLAMGLGLLGAVIGFLSGDFGIRGEQKEQNPSGR